MKHLITALTIGLAIPALAQDTIEQTDLLSFANGVLPIAIDTGGADFKTGMEQAISAIDGNPVGYVMTPKFGAPTDVLEITYALPAPTEFTRFAIPNVSETPSPFQTFFKTIEVLGANAVGGDYVPLASGMLVAHEDKGQVSELDLSADLPKVTFVKLRLSDGLSVLEEKTFFEFSEIIANGVQDPVPMNTAFTGSWKGRGVNIELAQEGPTVIGCYDKKDKLEGTVDGKVLRALGFNEGGVASQFILIADEAGALRGLRSTNGAPFKPYDGDATGKEPVCLAPEPPKLGCGAVIHGIGFDYDSDRLRPESGDVITALFEGLSAESAAKIEIIGHSSSEGAADYNQDLSQRRAGSVVAALVDLGIDAGRLAAGGRGEDEPIASNDDEAGRSLNRRVEILCTG